MCSSAKAVCIHRKDIPVNNSEQLNAEMKPEVALMKMPQCLATAIQLVTMCWNATRRFLSQCQNVARDRAQYCNTMNRIHSSWKYGIAILALSISLGHRKTLCLMVVALESAPPRGGRGSDVIKSVLWCSSKQKWHSLIEIPISALCWNATRRILSQCQKHSQKQS